MLRRFGWSLVRASAHAVMPICDDREIMKIEKMKLFGAIVGCSLALSAATAAERPLQQDPVAKAMAGRPNVLFILSDDQGYADVGFHEGIAQTPNLDKLAAEGLILNQHYFASPLCTPARAGLLTGRYNTGQVPFP